MDFELKSHEPVALLTATPGNLSFGEVTLILDSIKPGDAARGMVPYYHFRIRDAEGADVGHINLRVGDTEHIRVCAGHVGYKIAPEFRGHRYAYQACRALAPFIRTIYDAVVLTCAPTNMPSIRTIERLGATFIDEIAVPESDPTYLRGSRIKRQYFWTPDVP